MFTLLCERDSEGEFGSLAFCIYKLSRTRCRIWMRRRRAAQNIHQKQFRKETTAREWQITRAERIWEVLAREGSERKTGSDLWASFQRSRRAALSSPGHKSWKRYGTWRHKSGFPLLCRDWWNNVGNDVETALPVLSHSPSSLSFIPFLFPFLSSALSLSPPLTLLLFGLSAFRHSPPHNLFPSSSNLPLWSPELLLVLTPLDSIPKFYGLKWVV